jgi:hypothetical protein
MATPTDEYDFGFSFSDEEPVVVAAKPAANDDQLQNLESKLDSLLSAQEKAVESAYIAALEEKHKARLKEVEGLILPLLYNLKKNPEKAIINWPNRAPIIDKQIEKIIAITRS